MGFTAGLMAVGTGLSAMSQIQGGRDAERMGRFNAAAQEQQADYIDTQTRARVGSHLRDYEKFAGAQRADMAAYGASAKTGTGLLLAQEAARQAKLDELNLQIEGGNKANAARAGAQLSRFEGQSRRRQAVMGGLGTALKGGAQIWSMTQSEGG